MRVNPEDIDFGFNYTPIRTMPQTDFSLVNPVTSTPGLRGSTFGSNLGQASSSTNWLSDLMNWGKSNMGTAKEPGLIPMGFGGLMSLGNLFAANKQYGLQKDAFNFNKDMQLKSYGNQVKSYNDTIASNAQSDASNLFGARVGSEANNAYIAKMKQERSIT